MKKTTVFVSVIIVILMSFTVAHAQRTNLIENKHCHYFNTFFGNPNVGEESWAKLTCLGMYKTYNKEYVFFTDKNMNFIYDAIIQVKIADNKYLTLKTADYLNSEVPLADIEKLYQASSEKENKIIFNVFDGRRRVFQQPRSLDYLFKENTDIPKVIEID